MWIRRLNALGCAMLFVLVMAMGPGPALAESGTLADCLLGCIPGENACAECCRNAFPSPQGTECLKGYVICSEMCDSEAGTRAVTCFKECRDNLKACVEQHGAGTGEFSCPDWQQPKECPFECQAWNPRTRQCDGAPRSSCD